MTKKTPENKIESYYEAYNKITTIRAFVQLIPYIGGPIDTLISGKAARIQQERIMLFLEDIKEKMNYIQNEVIIEENDRFFDFIMKTMESVSKTHSREKIKIFSQIVKNQITRKDEWDSMDSVLYIVNDLLDIHIKITKIACESPICDGPFSNLRIISLITEQNNSDLDLGEKPPTNIYSALSQENPEIVRMACCHLIGKGILHDEGIGRWDVRSLQYLSPTNLAFWLMNKISDE